ncbi:MAG: hypothetical protein PHV28_10235, partial [Kiritimatiellae bacterium]|nr:hypothetical protein [Kiritimatiellia bacterium]
MKIIRVTVVSALAATVSVADNYTWAPFEGTGTVFQADSNWTPSGSVPGVSDTAAFSGANTYAVAFNGNVTNAGVTIGSPVAGTDAAFDLNGWLWKLTGTLGFGAAGAAGTATFGGGALEVENLVSVFNSQKLVLNGTSSHFKQRIVTEDGGVLEVGGGNHVFGPVPPQNASGVGLLMKASPSGVPSFRVTNGIVSVNGAFSSDLNKTTWISLEGGTLRVPSGSYGVVMEGPVTLDVHTNAVFENLSGRYYFGRRKGLSTINILGGAVTNTTSGGHIGSAYAPGSTSVVNLADGIFYSSGSLGFGGTSGTYTNAVGILSQSGGRVHMASILQFGFGVGAVGIYTQSGGTAWCSQLRLGNNNGSGSQGLVYLAGGTLALNSNPYLGNGVGCTGCIYQTGGELLVSNGMDLAVITNAFGLYHYKGGKARVNGSVSIGSGALSVGRMISEGSELSVLGNLNVASGVSSTGEVVVAGGSLVCPNVQYIGRGSNSVGRLCVTGGQLSCSNELQIGCAAGAFGGVYLTNGVITSVGGGHGYCLGYASGATGELVVAGGQLTAMNTYSILAGVGSNAFGSVTISGGTNDIRSLRIGHMG